MPRGNDCRQRGVIQGLHNVDWFEDVLKAVGFCEVAPDPEDNKFKVTSSRFVRKYTYGLDGQNPITVKVDRSRLQNTGWVNISSYDMERITHLVGAR